MLFFVSFSHIWNLNNSFVVLHILVFNIQNVFKEFWKLNKIIIKSGSLCICVYILFLKDFLFIFIILSISLLLSICLFYTFAPYCILLLLLCIMHQQHRYVLLLVVLLLFTLMKLSFWLCFHYYYCYLPYCGCDCCQFFGIT